MTCDEFRQEYDHLIHAPWDVTVEERAVLLGHQAKCPACLVWGREEVAKLWRPPAVGPETPTPKGIP